ncbi:MAG: PIN domain-containing protein [Pseudomonadota bacterium]
MRGNPWNSDRERRTSNVLRQHRHEQLRLFTSQLAVLPWDEDAAQHYGLIRAELRKQGLMIGGNDLLIAAQARAASAVLVTNHTRAFGRVPDLTVEDWLG